MAAAEVSAAESGASGRRTDRKSQALTAREINREQRFEQILRAAWVCFTKKGFHGTSMSDIAREAEISVGHLYNFFESKDAIVETFAKRELEQVREKDRYFKASNLPAEEICRRSVYELAMAKLDKTAARITFEILSEAVPNPRIRRAVKLYDAVWHEVLLPVYKQSSGLSEEEASLRLEADLSLVDGLYFRAMGNDDVDREALARRVAERVWLSLTGKATA